MQTIDRVNLRRMLRDHRVACALSGRTPDTDPRSAALAANAEKIEADILAAVVHPGGPGNIESRMASLRHGLALGVMRIDLVGGFWMAALDGTRTLAEASDWMIFSSEGALVARGPSDRMLDLAAATALMQFPSGPG